MKVLQFDDGFLVEVDILANQSFGIEPTGLINGSNVDFTTPEAFDVYSIRVYRNGQRQTLNEDFTIGESGGVGSGFDTITFAAACTPKTGSIIRVDYVAA